MPKSPGVVQQELHWRLWIVPSHKASQSPTTLNPKPLTPHENLTKPYRLSFIEPFKEPHAVLSPHYPRYWSWFSMELFKTA